MCLFVHAKMSVCYITMIFLTVLHSLLLITQKLLCYAMGSNLEFENDSLLILYHISTRGLKLDNFLFLISQGVLVFLAAKSEFVKDADEAALLQDFFICVEMLVAAVGHFYAFPYKEYAGANIGGSRGLTASLAHALKLNDFYHDTVHQASHF